MDGEIDSYKEIFLGLLEENKFLFEEKLNYLLKFDFFRPHCVDAILYSHLKFLNDFEHLHSVAFENLLSTSRIRQFMEDFSEMLPKQFKI